jgi:hypothetical protein
VNYIPLDLEKCYCELFVGVSLFERFIKTRFCQHEKCRRPHTVSHNSPHVCIVTLETM